MIRRYVSGTATPAESEAVRDYVADDTNRFDLLLELMRTQAMEELGIDPSDDFLPEHLRQCSPTIYESSPAFKDDAGSMAQSAELWHGKARSAYDMLKKELL